MVNFAELPNAATQDRFEIGQVIGDVDNLIDAVDDFALMASLVMAKRCG